MTNRRVRTPTSRVSRSGSSTQDRRITAPTGEPRPLLYTYFYDSAEVLRSHYERSRGQAAAANLGHNREAFCREFLRHTLPPRLSIGHGEILDSKGHRTGQLDTVIVRDDAPHLTFGGAETYLAEGVFAVVETKSNLTRAKLQEALETLRRVATVELVPSRVVGVSGAYLPRPLRCVFAYEGMDLQALTLLLLEPENRGLADVICILDRGAVIAAGLLLTFSMLRPDGSQAGPDDVPYIPYPGGAAALAWLYFHLVSFGSSFLARSIDLMPYFAPFTAWAD